MRGASRYAVIALVLCVGGIGGVAAGSVDRAKTLAAKAAPELVDRLVAGDSATIIVTGAPHRTVATTRAEVRAAHARAATPFLRRLRAAVEAAGGRVTGTWSAVPALAFRGGLAAAQAVAATPGVSTLTEDRPDAVHAEPFASGEDGAGVSNTGGRRMIQAEELWDLGFRGQGTRVANVATGVDPRHEAFKTASGSSRIVAFLDLVNGSATPYDDHGIGTHTAATSAGSDEFADPVHGRFQETGVAPRAALVAVKFLDAGGSGSFANAMTALQFAFDQGSDVAVNPWGASCSASIVPVVALVRQLTELGMVSVFPTGGGGPGAGTIGGPGCSAYSLTIGGVDGGRSIASFSGRGPCVDPESSTSRPCPDLVAKAVNVRSAVPRDGAPVSDPTGYRTLSGTSYAAAFVGGAVALIEQAKRFYTGVGWDTASQQEKLVLTQTALDLGAPGRDDSYGWGLPQLLSVVDLLRDPAPYVQPYLSIPASAMRFGESATLVFEVQNRGAPVVHGELTATLTTPDGTTTTVHSSTPSLDLFERAAATHAMNVAGATPAGTYTFAGRFDYSWTDDSGAPQTGSVARSGTFDVVRPVLGVEVSGYAPVASPVLPQDLTFVLRNTGNEAATAVVLDATFRDAYEFLPGDGFTVENLDSRYASPAPDSVRHDRNFGRVTLSFGRESLAVGESLTIRVRVSALRTGTFTLTLRAAWKDGVGRPSSQGVTLSQTVAV